MADIGGEIVHLQLRGVAAGEGGVRAILAGLAAIAVGVGVEEGTDVGGDGDGGYIGKSIQDFGC